MRPAAGHDPETLVAVLCNEPFGLRPWEVAELTPYQAQALYLGVGRDRHGRVRLKLSDPDAEE